MIRSMTAFARTGSATEAHWAVEVRSLNHRYFEFSAKLPPFLYPLEPRIKEFVQARMRRGKVTMLVSQDLGEESSKEFVLDEAVVKRYQVALNKLRKTLTAFLEAFELVEAGTPRRKKDGFSSFSVFTGPVKS